MRCGGRSPPASATSNGFRSDASTHFPSLLERDDVESMLTELEARLKAEALVAQETTPAPGATPNPNLVAPGT